MEKEKHETDYLQENGISSVINKSNSMFLINAYLNNFNSDGICTSKFIIFIRMIYKVRINNSVVFWDIFNNFYTQIIVFLSCVIKQ